MERKPIHINDFEQIPEIGEEFIQTLFQNKNIRIEKIFTNGKIAAPSKWYKQVEDEWVMLFQGQAQIKFADGHDIVMEGGDCFFIPAGIEHQLVNTSDQPPCIWLTIFIE